MTTSFQWWRNTALRIAKKHVNRTWFWQDGTLYHWTEYQLLLTLVAGLKPGDPIWNCFIGGMDRVAEVWIEWRPLAGKYRPREDRCRAIKGEVVNQFRIKTETGYFIYNLEWLQPWNPCPPTTEERQTLNRAIGIESTIETWTEVIEWWRHRSMTPTRSSGCLSVAPGFSAPGARPSHPMTALSLLTIDLL